MSDKVLYPSLLAIPRPKLGGAMHRRTLVNQCEEAIVLSILSHPISKESWTATLMTKNGVEFVSGDVEHRTVYNWMPEGWVYDVEKAGWLPPKKVLRKSNASAVIEDPDEAVKQASKLMYALPEPWDGEKFMAWRARVYKSVPRLKEVASCASIVSKAWKEKEYQVSM